MARGKSLLKLLGDLRAETRTSSNPAHNAGVHDEHASLLRRTQEWLYDDFDWPFLRVRRYIDLQAGQRYYDTPEDLSLDRLDEIAVRYGREWRPVRHGIDDLEYAVYDSDAGERGWPVQQWGIHEGEMIEVWPVPNQNGAAYRVTNPDNLEGRLRLEGVRNLAPLVADDDIADLDDRLIVLTAAAEMLAADGAPDAAVKAQAAEKRFRRLRGQQAKTDTFRLFGSSDRPHRPRSLPAPTYTRGH